MGRLIDFYKNLFIENRQWLKATVKWFLATAVLGAITFFIRPELLKIIVDGFVQKFGTNPELNFHLVLQIFQQNIIASAVALFGGFIFGLGSIVIVGINGFILGFVGVSLFFVNPDNIGVSISLALGGLVPHGIFELPAFLLAASLGFRLGLEWISRQAEGNRWQILKQNFKQSLLALPVIVLMLFIAALIEVFVSGKLVDKF